MFELKNEKIAIPVVLFAGLLWSFGPLVVRHMDQPEFVTWQYIFARGLTIFIVLNLYLYFEEGINFYKNYFKIGSSGIFSLLQIEFDLTVLAAILAVIGYSLNDTIVVFDRIRENFLSTRHIEPGPIVNDALNQTLSRTLMTSLTTLIVLLALFYLGGEVIHSFAGALIIGVVIGTYSSIYVASSMILVLGISKEDILPSEKEKKEIDARP